MAFGKKRRKTSGEMVLQITSMADIFMILLVFLLKSYSATLQSMTPMGDTQLPEAVAKGEIKDTLKIEISKTSLLVDQKPTVKLTNYLFPQELANGYNILNDTLAEARKTSGKFDPNLVILADHKTPYETLKVVMASAASQGYVDLQLLVVEGG